MRYRSTLVWIPILLLVATAPALAFDRDLDPRDRGSLRVASTPLPRVDGPGAGETGDVAPLTPEQVAALAADHDGSFEAALRVVVEFLQLRPEQARELLELLERRREAVLPLAHEIGRREAALQKLIAQHGDPTAIGRLVLEIHALRQEVMRIQAEFLNAFEHLLDREQLERFGAVRRALRLQPVLPAFRALSLI